MAGDQPPAGLEPAPVSDIAGDRRTPTAIDLSIVVPVYNEQENLPLLWPEIREVLDPTNLRYEVIFVDDGSRDGSFTLIEKLHRSDARVRAIQLRRNFGKAAALAVGFREAGV